MHKIITLLVTSLLVTGITAQNTLVVSNTNSPSKEISNATKIAADDVLVLTEAEFDFGKIPQGKPVTHIFEVANNGKDSLYIVNVQASCGCTTPQWETGRAFASGEKTNITVGYNAAAEGKFTKPVTITYNGTLSKQVVIKGEVWKTPVTSAPENKELENLKD